MSVTATAVGAGGIPPYEFKWRVNGILLRDWDSAPTLTWDLTVGGQPVFPSGYTLSVEGRSSGGSEPEAFDSVRFIVL